MDKETRLTLSVFLIAFAVRSVAATLTTITDLNPDSQADAIKFGNTAESIAGGIREGDPYLYTSSSIDLGQLLLPIGSIQTYEMWGTFLAPFWLLPGPSGFYARVGNALLGAFAIYNVYLVARYYHSHHAGVIAVFPMALYPSFVAVHSTLLREAIILFGITTAVRFLMVPSERRSQFLSYTVAGIVLYVALLQRTDNVVIYAMAFSAALTVYGIRTGYISKRTIGIATALSPIAFVLSLPLVRDGVEFLAWTREIRAQGRAVYLPELIPRTILELGAFSWIGAAYFLYAPFPWMIQTAPDLLVGIEGLVSIAFTVAAVWGVRSLFQKNAPATVGLLVGFAVAVVLYGVGTVNYGTGMRHRQMFIWVIFLFGGLGISEYVEFRWPFDTESPDPDAADRQ